MSKNVTVGNQDFEIPDPGQNPGYAEQLTDFFVALADNLASIVGPNDIALTTAVIANNVTAFTPIPGFSFSTASVRQIEATYLVERSTVSPAQAFVEDGEIKGNFDGQNWTITIKHRNSAGIELDILPTGQIVYKSSNITGTSYNGIIRFRAKTISNT